MVLVCCYHKICKNLAFACRYQIFLDDISLLQISVEGKYIFLLLIDVLQIDFRRISPINGEDVRDWLIIFIGPHYHMHV